MLSSVIPTLPAGTVLNVIGPNGVASTSEDTQFRSTSQEIQMLGNTGFMAGSLEYVLGAYYYEDKATLDIFGGAIGSGPLILQNLTGIANKSYAGFGEVTVRPGADEKLSITVGARYSHDKRTATRINERSFSFAALGGFTAENCGFFALTFAALVGRGLPLSYNQTRKRGSPPSSASNASSPKSPSLNSLPPCGPLVGASWCSPSA